MATSKIRKNTSIINLQGRLGHLQQTLDDESVRLAGVAAIIRLAMEGSGAEADALGIALDVVEDANAQISEVSVQLRSMEAPDA